MINTAPLKKREKHPLMNLPVPQTQRPSWQDMHGCRSGWDHFCWFLHSISLRFGKRKLGLHKFFTLKGSSWSLTCRIRYFLGLTSTYLSVLAWLVLRSQTFTLTAEGQESMAAFTGQGPAMRPFDRHYKQPITVCFAHHDVSGCRNVTTITENSWPYFKDLIFYIVLKIQLSFVRGLASRHLCFQVER